MKKIVSVAAGLAVVPVLAFAMPAFADSPGQLEGGPNIYEVKNLTQNGSYATTVSAKACDELEYSVELHNTEFGKLSNIMVSATLPSTSAITNVSNMTATTAAGGTTGTSGKVTVDLSSAQTIAYEQGSTELFDGSGKAMQSLPDGITSANGVNVGDLNGSTTEFVNFKAKVNCPTPPVTPPVTPPTTPPTTPPVSQLPNTGAGDTIALFLGAALAGMVGFRVFMSRKQARR